jgi:hypothetical protein
MAYPMDEPSDDIQRLLMERERLLHEQDQKRAQLRELLMAECKRLMHDIDFLRERINAIQGSDVPPGGDDRFSLIAAQKRALEGQAAAAFGGGARPGGY